MSQIHEQDLFASLKDSKILLVGELMDILDVFTEEGYTSLKYVGDEPEVSRNFLMSWIAPGKLHMVVLNAELQDGDSFDLCRRLTNEEALLVVMVGESGINEWKALHAGARDYVVSKAGPEIAYHRCEKVLASQHFSQQLEKSGQRYQKMFVNILQVMTKVLEARDPTTMHHSEDVARYARRLARRLGWSEDRVRVLGIAAMLHDIGKVGIPEALLTKPGPLTTEEYEIFKKHPLVAEAILDPIPELRATIEMVKHHHERYDGSGYPDGLEGENIPLGARIIHVTDAYECMLALRPYRQVPLTKEEAIEELNRCSGTQFDSKLVDVFIEMEKKDALPRSRC